MAGILDNKKRILDSIITKYGRKQLKDGLDISFVSFSDEGHFYDSDDGVIVKDISNKLIFEASSLPKDVIIPLLDTNGNISLDLSNGNKIVNGKRVISGTLTNSIVSGSTQIYSGAIEAIATTLDNFSNNRIIRTNDGINTNDFIVNKNSIDIKTENKYIPINFIKPLLFDDSVNHTINSKYLPPIVKDSNISIPLGDYDKITKEPYSNFKELIKNELDKKVISKQEILFSKTTNFNNILGQIFEIENNSLNKLAIIDLGEFVNLSKERKKVYVVGKIISQNNENKFCKLFTLVFSNEN